MIEPKRINNLEFKVATYLLKNPPEIKAYHINRYMPNCYYGHESDFIKIDDGDFTEKTKEDILSAYNIIRHELVQLNSCEDNKINIKPAKYVAYSFERREE